MHPAQGAGQVVVRGVALGKVGVKAALAEFSLAVGAGEKASLVAVTLELDDEQAGDRRLDEAHRRILPRFGRELAG